ncbi:MAG: DNA polymerase III subunit delta' [Desulfurivibrio sp.]|nr:DNA polymerase III subunit delta' [Desulfurivibrio sp.]
MLSRFSQLRAQNPAKEMLSRALKSGKLAHAYLCRGPAGVGKKRAAHALAATLNCHQLPAAAGDDHRANLEVCGSCPSCRKFATDSHPDLLTVSPEGAAIKIQQVREIKKALRFPPLEGSYRVVLVSEVQTMRREAANSLLKILEEPPPATIFILTGDEAGAILPTILSRCQVIPFYALEIDEVAAMLSAEDEQLTPAAAATLAALAEGSPGRARLLRQKELLPLRREILQTLLTRQIDEPAALESVLELAERGAALKEELPELLELLTGCFHDLAVLAAAGRSADHRRPLLNRDLQAELQQGAGRWDFPQLVSRLQRLRQARRQLARNCNRGLVCEVLFFDLL